MTVLVVVCWLPGTGKTTRDGPRFLLDTTAARRALETAAAVVLPSR